MEWEWTAVCGELCGCGQNVWVGGEEVVDAECGVVALVVVVEGMGVRGDEGGSWCGRRGLPGDGG